MPNSSSSPSAPLRSAPRPAKLAEPANRACYGQDMSVVRIHSAIVFSVLLCVALPAQGQPPQPSTTSALDAGADAIADEESDAGADELDGGLPKSATSDPEDPKPKQPAKRPRERGEDLTVYVLTMGPGSHPFYKFGHNAIWIHNKRNNRSRVYNYGTFTFGSAALIPKFFMGRFRYSLSRRSLRGSLSSYRRHNRWVTAQKLNLTPEQRFELRKFLRWNAKRANRYYKYDYYRDNCSTRVRDAIDKVLGGRLRQIAAKPGSMSYRDHTLRLTADLLTEYVVLHAVLGDLVDRPTTEWEEAFLPMKLRQTLQRATVIGPDGQPQPLVLSEQRLVKSTRTPPLTEPPSWFSYFLGVGVLTGSALALLGRVGRRKAGRLLHATTLSLLGLVFGFFGTFFTLLWLLTDHAVAHRNENILQCPPWLFVLPLFVVGLARGRPKTLRRVWWLTAAAAISAGLGLLCKALPWFDQNNWQIIGFSLPTLVGAALGVRWLRAGMEKGAGAKVASPADSSTQADSSGPEP